jgi:hypothetical protein
LVGNWETSLGETPAFGVLVLNQNATGYYLSHKGGLRYCFPWRVEDDQLVWGRKGAMKSGRLRSVLQTSLEPLGVSFPCRGNTLEDS